MSSGVSEAAVLFKPMKTVVGKLGRKGVIIEVVLLAALGMKV